jgi:Na+-transporting NADH:ubiquinone oxidoreductase subunit NqrF
MTQISGSNLPWKGEIGYIDYQLIVKHLQRDTSSVKRLLGPVYYMAGPPAMVVGLRTMLNKAGIDDDDIRTEEFTGY